MQAGEHTLFVFEAVGTRGDIAPLLGLAEQLIQRGHPCQLIAPAAFEAEALAIGARFRASTARSLNFSAAEAVEFESYYFPGLERVVEHFAELASEGTRVIVVNIDKTCASNLMAEKYGLPVVRLDLSPFKIRSLVSPPWPFRERTRGAFGRAYLKHTLPQLLEKADKEPRLLAYVNGKRLELGLPRIESLAHFVVQKELGLFPGWFCEPASDWPAALELVGFPLSAPHGELAAPLLELIEREGAPLVFTTGTGVADVERFFEHARACCEELGLPGVLLSPHLKGPLGPRILGLDYAELGLLLPRAALFVHHGGIGGTARALAAGVPQIVCPIGFDQPDNAQRVVELGVGQIVERGALSGARLAQVARQLLASPECAVRAQVHKRQLESESGLQRGSDQLESMLPGALPALPAGMRHAAAAGSGRSVVFVVWPEPGHVAAPLELARQLRERGDRVVFAGLELIATPIQQAGFEFFELAPLVLSPERIPYSILWRWSGEDSLADAAAALMRRFSQLVQRAAPDLILFDSLYSLLGCLASAHDLPWALYETDLPRELDPEVPPPGSELSPGPANRQALRDEWATLLRQTARSRSHQRRRGCAGGWSMASGYPDALLNELSQQLGRKRMRIRRATAVAPVAVAERLIFCPRAFDFERSRTEGFSWVDPCVGAERPEPSFPWHELPADRPLVYCSLGTQALRTPRAPRVLQAVLEAFAELRGPFLVMARGRFQPAPTAVPSDNSLLVSWAPQLGLIRRASLVITHGGFNTVKECVSHAVPMIVAPLSHDQPRNAVLVQHHGLGVSLGLGDPEPASIRAAILEVLESRDVRLSCQRFAEEFRAEGARRSALAAVDRLMSARARA